MDLLTIIHDIGSLCNKCGHVSEYEELLVSDTGREDDTGRNIYYVIGIMNGEGYSGERAKCHGCGLTLDWLMLKLKSKVDKEIIQSVKEWLNNQ